MNEVLSIVIPSIIILLICFCLFMPEHNKCSGCFYEHCSKIEYPCACCSRNAVNSLKDNYEEKNTTEKVVYQYRNGKKGCGDCKYYDKDGFEDPCSTCILNFGTDDNFKEDTDGDSK